MSESLFKYHVRVSPKARMVRLRVTLQKGLEVVIPKGYDESKIPRLLEHKKHWVRAALERTESNRKFFEPEPNWRLPIQIRLPAIGAVWHVSSKQTDVEWVAVREISPERLLVFGAIDDQEACQAALVRWLMRQAHRHLLPRLQSLSIKTGLRYKRALVKRQRTRWASCSKRGTISLNAKLLFLPPMAVDYAMTHELCHLAEMNHSKRFWQLVERHYPGYRKIDAQLRNMWKAVPRWATFNPEVYDRRNSPI
jgi:predicted metal-dependent hydrolase